MLSFKFVDYEKIYCRHLFQYAVLYFLLGLVERGAKDHREGRRSV